MNKKILAIPGSLRADSSSHVVLVEIQKMLEEKATVELYEGVKNIPHFDGREEEPVEVIEFKNKIKEADAVLICTPEYAFGVPGSLKNALDWTVSSGEFVDKPTALITASSQGEKGHQALQQVLTAISAKIYPETTLLISFIRAKVKDGKIADAQTKQAVESVAESLLKVLK